MKFRNLVLLAIVMCGVILGPSAHAHDVPKYFQSVATTTGKAGTLNADGSYRINIARTDVQFVSSGGIPVVVIEILQISTGCLEHLG